MLSWCLQPQRGWSHVPVAVLAQIYNIDTCTVTLLTCIQLYTSKAILTVVYIIIVDCFVTIQLSIRQMHCTVCVQLAQPRNPTYATSPCIHCNCWLVVCHFQFHYLVLHFITSGCQCANVVTVYSTYTSCHSLSQMTMVVHRLEPYMWNELYA